MAIVLGYVVFEICSNRYGKLNIPLLFHHLALIFCVVFSLLGFFLPFFSWYLMLELFAFPIPLSLGIRLNYSSKHPQFSVYLHLYENYFCFSIGKRVSRIIIRCSFYYYSINSLLNICGMLFIFVNSSINNQVTWFELTTFVIAFFGFGIDDCLLLYALWEFAQTSYEKFSILHKARSPRVLFFCCFYFA